MEGGNKYTTAVVSSAEDRLTVIIREVYQHPSQAGQLSFPSRGVEKLQPYISGSVFQPGLEEERARLAEANGLDDELNNQE